MPIAASPFSRASRSPGGLGLSALQVQPSADRSGPLAHGGRRDYERRQPG